MKGIAREKKALAHPSPLIVIHARVEVLHGAQRPACSFAGPQPGLERTDERRVPQRGSEHLRQNVSFSQICGLRHLGLDPTLCEVVGDGVRE